MHTPQSGTLNIVKLSGGEYVYLGIAKGIENAISGSEVAVPKYELSLNVDGVPIYSSKKTSAWPIQVTIDNIPHLCNKPFVTAIFYGPSKPDNLDFLNDTVDELQLLSKNGLGGKDVVIRNIICDAPARALVKGTIQFNGLFGCDYCEARGVKDGGMLFLYEGIPRTDASFRAQTNPLHHKSVSPFVKLEQIDMIKNFPIDPMHNVDLGVTKRLLLTWKEGPLPTRLSQQHINRVSSFLELSRQHIPSVFNRKPRSLNELKFWKATELRTFLMYVGPLALKQTLDAEKYCHFLSLSIAIRILFSKQLLDEHGQFAKQLLVFFVQNARRIYGQRFLTYNTHCLLHLPVVAEFNNGLSNCTAYKYENNMQMIKKCVRGTGNPLIQICNRLSERSDFKKENQNPARELKPNDCVLLRNGNFAAIHSVSKDGVLCEIFEKTSSLFTSPCDSRIVGIHKGLITNTEMSMQTVDAIKSLPLSIPLHLSDTTKTKEVALITLLHTH